MADGDPLDSGAIAHGVFHTSWKGTDAATATSNGVWLDVRGWKSFTIHCTGGTGTIQVRGSNAVSKPANATDDAQLGPDIALANTQSVLSVEVPIRWMKTKVSAYTGGSLSAFIHTIIP